MVETLGVENTVCNEDEMRVDSIAIHVAECSEQSSHNSLPLLQIAVGDE